MGAAVFATERSEMQLPTLYVRPGPEEFGDMAGVKSFLGKVAGGVGKGVKTVGKAAVGAVKTTAKAGINAAASHYLGIGPIFGGGGGEQQQGAGGGSQPAGGISPVVLVAGAAGVGLVLFLALRKK